VILLDLMMPVMDGWQFRSRLCKEPDLSGIPIIVLTEIGDHWGLPDGTVAHLRKPVDLNHLLVEIQRCAA
jgi:CheY-like chemotaxis protein